MMSENTITNVFSTTKTMASLAALVLVAPGGESRSLTRTSSAAYWPGVRGPWCRESSVRQLLSHTSGVSGWGPAGDHRRLYDWDKSTAGMLAAQAPWWEPGVGSGYHAR